VALGKIIRYVPNVWVHEATALVKENMAILWANDRKRSYPGLGFERGWVDESRGETKKSNTTDFSPGNEKPILWTGYVRVMRTQNVIRLRSGKDNSYCDQVMKNS
jgi:hypothetical protein